MSRGEEDEAWRAIVENYGDRPQVDARPEPVEPEPDPFDPTYDDLDAPEPTDRFVPPTPPPGPGLVLPRHLPWLGVFGAPAVLLVALVTGLDLPSWLGYLLVASFVGGFVHLVFTMNRGGRDPWDDGARI